MADQSEQVPTTGLVGTKQQLGPTKRRQYSEALNRQMVVETRAPRASVSIVARRHDVNSNRLFRWRRPLLPKAVVPRPEHLPREDLRHPAPCTCPGCGGALRKIGDEVTETLDYVPSRFKVVRHIREKLSCRARATWWRRRRPISRPITRSPGRAGAGLLAQIVVSKCDDHLPIYRQAVIFAHDRVSPETSTPSGWVGATAGGVEAARGRPRCRRPRRRHALCRRHTMSTTHRVSAALNGRASDTLHAAILGLPFVRTSPR
jgi:transposase